MKELLKSQNWQDHLLLRGVRSFITGELFILSPDMLLNDVVLPTGLGEQDDESKEKWRGNGSNNHLHHKRFPLCRISSVPPAPNRKCYSLNNKCM